MQGGAHPEKSSLLTFLRGQRFEDSERIRLHLTHCSQCQETCAALSRDSRPLDILNQMSRYQRYSELSPALILSQARRNEQQQTLSSQVTVGARFIMLFRLPDVKRRTQSVWESGSRNINPAPSSVPALNQPRPKKASLRLVSLPAAFGLLLLSMTVIIVAAYTLSHFAVLPYLPGASPGSIFPNTRLSTGVSFQGHVSPTPSPPQSVTATATVPVTGSPTPTGTPAASDHTPFITICPGKFDTTYTILLICGYNFKQGDKVILTSNSPGHKTFLLEPAAKVDQNGKFTAYLVIISCKYVSLEITARDISSKPVVTARVLIDLTTRGCPGANTQQG